MSTQISASHNLEDRVIRIFISSTFSDMQEERNLLVTKVFPRLAKIAAKRDVTIVPLDLRWGVTEEAALQGKVIETCLNEIIRSRPFFIGLIGNRYGSCLTMEESQKNKELLKQYEWLAEDMENGLSVTEIEIQYGVLRYPETIDAFFYLKEADEHTSDNPEKLSKLKKNIRENGRYPVKEYTTAKELVDKVEEQFLKVLDKHFPDRPLSRLEKERFNQHAFMRSRKIAYIPLPEAYQTLDDFLQNDEQNLVVTGESGMGKSALIANWIDVRRNQTNRKVIYHFVSNGGLEGDYHAIQQRLCDEIRDLYNLPQSDENKGASKKLEDELKNLFMGIAGREPLLIVLDGINQLSEAENAKQLLWLPSPPPNVKYLFSTLPADRTMEVFKMRHYPVYTLAPLDTARRSLLVTTYLKEYGKELSKKRVDRIIHDPQSENTLVLRSLLDELIGFGSHERLDERIDYYLEAQSIEDFFQRVLQRMEEDLGEQTVRHILSLVAFSQYGLSEPEIMEMANLNAYDWSVFHGVFRNYFTIKSGLLTFSHRYMAEACLARYAGEEQHARQEIIAKFSRQDDSRAWDELAFQYYALEDGDNLYALLLRLEVFDFLNIKNEYQLGSYWRLLRQIDENKYTPTAYLDCNTDGSKADYYYNQLGVFFVNIIVDLSDALLFLKKSLAIKEKNHPDTAILYDNIGSVYFGQGDYPKALEYCFKALAIREKEFGLDHPDIATSYNNIGFVYSSQGNYPRALEYYSKALAIQGKVLGLDHSNTAGSYNNIGAVYFNQGNYPRALEYYSKALAIQGKVLGLDHSNTAGSYNNIGAVYFNQGNYPKALEYYFKALAIEERVLGLDHPATATFYNNFGSIYFGQGDYPKSLEYYFKALDIREKTLGLDHPDTAGSYNNIGLVYSSQGDYPKSLEYYFKALDIQERVLGLDHPDIATSYNNIGLVYSSQGNYLKALEYYFKALDIQEKVLGLDHPNTAGSYNNIGLVYFSQGDYPKSLEYHFKALDIQKRVLGLNHLDIATFYNNIGLVYSRQGDYPKSLEYYFKALDIREKTLGLDHPDTAGSYNNIGLVYSSQGDYPKALEYHFKALSVREKVLGLDHPNTAGSYNNIGAVYSRQGDYPKALEYHFKALSVREKVLGLDHPDTAISYNNIGLVYSRQGDYPKALEYYFKALDIQEKKLGLDHPDTAGSYNNIGLVYSRQGNYPRALEYYSKALAIQEKVLGLDHPDTVRSCNNIIKIATFYNNIGETYYNQGDYPKALEYYSKALAIQEKVLGLDHPNIATLYNNIGGVYFDQGDYPEALEYYFKTVTILENAFGLNHPDTATCYSCIGYVYEKLKDNSRALAYYSKVLSIREKILGFDHPDTICSYNDVGAMYEVSGEYEKAIQYYSEALVQRRKIYGNEHTETSKSYKNIGNVYALQGDYARALEYYGKALAIREKILGKDHDDTIAVKQEIEKINLSLSNQR